MIQFLILLKKNRPLRTSTRLRAKFCRPLVHCARPIDVANEWVATYHQHHRYLIPSRAEVWQTA